MHAKEERNSMLPPYAIITYIVLHTIPIHNIIQSRTQQEGKPLPPAETLQHAVVLCLGGPAIGVVVGAFASYVRYHTCLTLVLAFAWLPTYVMMPPTQPLVPCPPLSRHNQHTRIHTHLVINNTNRCWASSSTIRPRKLPPRSFVVMAPI